MEEKLLGVIAKVFNREVSELTMDTRFNEDLDAESMQKFTIIAEITEMTGARIVYQKFNKCKTIGEAIEFTKSLMK